MMSGSASGAAPPTLGERLDRQARATLARRAEPGRRAAARDQPVRAGTAPGERRLRVEADVPPAWDDDPQLVGAAAPAGPTRFPAELRALLEPVLGPGLERALVHDGDADPEADAHARAHDAAAVTVGRQILLRQGRFAPHTPAGRALLAHEAVHVVAAARPGAAWQRATSAGRAGEEEEAQAVGAAVAAVPVIDPDPDGASDPARAIAAPAPIRRAAPGPDPGPGPVVRARRLLHADRGPVRPAVAGATHVAPAASGAGTLAHRQVPPPAAAPGFAAAPALPAARTSALATPMAAPATPMAAPATPPPAPPPPAPGPSREAGLHELLRQMRTDRERGA